MNLFEKLNRLDDSLVESKRIVEKKKLTESYSNQMTEFMNWIQEYRNGALWNDFTAEFESEEDPDIGVVLTWLENFDEDAYYDYVAAETYDDEIDEMLTETTSFKSGDRYYGGLPSEPSMSEYGKAMDTARKNHDALIDKYGIKVDKAKGYTTYTGTINGHTFKYVEGNRDFSRWLSELVIDNKTVNPYESSIDRIRKMFETNSVSISDVVDLLLKDNFDNIVYKESLTESQQEYELSTLVKDSINHLVNDIGKDPMADDFGDDVCADLENNYDIEVPDDMLKYANWCDAVMCEVSRQVNKLEEELTDKDVQLGVHQFSTESIIFRGTEEECIKYIDDRKDLWDDAEVYAMTPDDPHYKKDLTEAIDPTKAQEMRKNSDAYVVFYGYQHKGDKPVEVGPEEMSEEEFEFKKNQIIRSFDKLSSDKPKSNRYGKESDIMFYALYKK